MPQSRHRFSSCLIGFLLTVSISASLFACDSSPPKQKASLADNGVAKTAAGSSTVLLKLPSAEGAAKKKTTTAPKLWDFEEGTLGSLPKDWTSTKGDWQLTSLQEAPSGMRVLSQVGKSRGPIFNVALAPSEQAADLDLRVQLRASSGKIDQGGGVVWRAQDAKNYYVARYNPLEDNYRVYIVKDGRRKKLASADVDRKAADKWYTLRVTMQGDKISAYLDGKMHMEVQNSTFAKQGQVGLWTKADAITQFDTLTVSDAGKTP